MKDWRELSAKDLITKVEEINKELEGGDGHEPWVNITGTPFESLWPTKHVFYNGGDYMTLAYGEDRQTPWGPLPQIILLIRRDIANKLLQESDIKDNKPLMGPDWKPAPGFERPW